MDPVQLLCTSHSGFVTMQYFGPKQVGFESCFKCLKVCKELVVDIGTGTRRNGHSKDIFEYLTHPINGDEMLMGKVSDERSNTISILSGA